MPVAGYTGVRANQDHHERSGDDSHRRSEDHRSAPWTSTYRLPRTIRDYWAYFYDNTVGTAVNTENLALHKTVTQSSNYSGDSPQNFVDGNIYSFSHTANDAHEWVQVDLSPGTNTQLTQIKLVNRDSAGDRLQNFTVSVIASDGTVVWSQSYNASTYDGEVITFETGKIAGEYVRVQKNDANFLHLAEIQVFNLSIQNPDIVRVDPTIDFNWGNESMPAPGIPGSNWSATWLGKIQANYSEDYTFYLTGDDTVRLWINDQPVCGGYCGSFSGPVHLEAGQWYSIRLDFVQNAGYENVKLEWSSASQAREVIPSSQLSHEDTAPVNIAPSQQTTDLNTPIVFSQANGNADSGFGRGCDLRTASGLAHRGSRQPYAA